MLGIAEQISAGKQTKETHKTSAIGDMIDQLPWSIGCYVQSIFSIGWRRSINFNLARQNYLYSTTKARCIEVVILSSTPATMYYMVLQYVTTDITTFAHRMFYGQPGHTSVIQEHPMDIDGYLGNNKLCRLSRVKSGSRWHINIFRRLNDWWLD